MALTLRHAWELLYLYSGGENPRSRSIFSQKPFTPEQSAPRQGGFDDGRTDLPPVGDVSSKKILFANLAALLNEVSQIVFNKVFSKVLNLGIWADTNSAYEQNS
ncbi:hypothetical protein [Myxacorys almedinensis]|uniref:Uncharacterized protein n=1 Tax=Myxacorys almedinensis A TaxID=2690445 RepID=A0A8J7Z3R4_9CYAN|nr:hypothetical protein [Myxacorys almedinensis]NDJ19439.1 hypothetical protein [Myxacorys almedinensis A]